MDTQHSFEEDDIPERELAMRIIVLALARKLYSEGLTAKQVKSRKQFRALVDEIGKGDEAPFEIHLDGVAEDSKTIGSCIASGAHSSAIVLLFTLFEAQLNATIRIALRIYGYSNGAAVSALKGTGFITKVDVLAPLLGAHMSQTLRHIVVDCKTVRNAIVHSKMAPARMTDQGDHPSENEANADSARDFFNVHKLDDIERKLRHFVDSSISNISEVRDAWAVLDKYMP